jgi:hypothetical protein
VKELNPPAEIRPAVDLAQLAIEARRLRDGIAAAEDTVKRESEKLAQRRKRLGEILVEARTKAFSRRGDGFTEWVEKELGLTVSTANNYMRAVGYEGGGRGRKPTTDAPDYSNSWNNPTQRAEVSDSEVSDSVSEIPIDLAPPPNREKPNAKGWVCEACGAPNREKDTGCAKCGTPRDPVEHARARQALIAKLDAEAEERRQAALAPLRMEARESATAKALDALEASIAAFNKLHGDGVHLSDCTVSPGEFEEVKRRALLLYRLLRDELRSIHVDIDGAEDEPPPVVKKRQLSLVPGDKA